MLRNVFACRYGKAEPELLLTKIHDHGPLTLAELSQLTTAFQVREWLPVLGNRGDVIRWADMVSCGCEECETQLLAEKEGHGC